MDIQKTSHAPVRTSEEAAEVRGATLASGAKAMLLAIKVGSASSMVLVVISASAKMDSKAFKKTVPGCKSTRFASEEEVKTITGCVPGAVPPFGSVWGLQTYMDASLVEQGPTINFNAGLRTHSVQMKVADFVTVEAPVECRVKA